MNRRSFLKLAAVAGAELALGSSDVAYARSGERDLLVVSNAGGSGSVSLIDPEAVQVVRTLPLSGSFAFPAARWDFSRDLIWAGLGEGVAAWRLSSGEQIAQIPTGSAQNYTELTPDGRFLIVTARFADRYFKVVADPEDPEFGRVVAEVESYAGASPCDITISRDGRYGYAPERGGHTITTLAIEPFEISSTTTIAPAVEPYMATVSPAGNLLLVENAVVEGASELGSESLFDLADPERPLEVARFSQQEGLGVRPISSEFSLDGRYGIVICRDSSELTVIDVEKPAVVASVPFPSGSNPVNGSFVYGSNGERFFVPLPGRDAVAVVRVPEFELETLLPVGPRPLGIVHLTTALPERDAVDVRHRAEWVGTRAFPPGCPDPCCGSV